MEENKFASKTIEQLQQELFFLKESIMFDAEDPTIQLEDLSKD